MADKKGYQGVLKYTVTTPVWDRPSQACRYALAGTRQKQMTGKPSRSDLANMETFALVPKLGTKARPQVQDFIATHTGQIIRDWRAQLQKLLDAGWPPLREEKAWYRAQNCPPVGVNTTGKSRQPPCCYRQLCPWCWCRTHVRETFLNVEYAIFGSNSIKDYNPRSDREETNLPNGPYDLLVFERDFGTYPVGYMPRMWEDVRATRQLTQDFLARRHGRRLHGLYYMYVIYPTKPGPDQPSEFAMEKRIIALTDKMFEWEEGEGRVEQYPDGRYSGSLFCKKRCRKLSRREIIGAVGMACRYPRQLLYGPASMLQLLLEQKRRRLIPKEERDRVLAQELEEERRKPAEYQNPAVLNGPARTYERNSGIRLTANLGLFRNRGVRLRRVHHMTEDQEPER